MVGARGKSKILCIEDDWETAELMEEDLKERGFLVSIAHDGPSGLTAILKEKPDLVISDIHMPMMSGFHVLERLTAEPDRFARIPFIFITAMADRENELKGRNLGADDYIVKPIDFEILAAIIKARLSAVARESNKTKPSVLNDREAEILTLAARGNSSAEIARSIGLCKRTVDFHIDNARIKLGASTRTAAVSKAIYNRYIEP